MDAVKDILLNSYSQLFHDKHFLPFLFFLFFKCSGALKNFYHFLHCMITLLSVVHACFDGWQGYESSPEGIQLWVFYMTPQRKSPTSRFAESISIEGYQIQWDWWTYSTCTIFMTQRNAPLSLRMASRYEHDNIHFWSYLFCNANKEFFLKLTQRIVKDVSLILSKTPPSIHPSLGVLGFLKGTLLCHSNLT